MSTDQKSANWYEENAKSYTVKVRDENVSVYHSYYEKPAMYKLLPDIKGLDVLSVGCGSGEDSSHLKKQGANRSMGIDLSKGLIEIAKETYKECEFEVMDMEKLDFPDASFDLVYSSLAIHYVENWGNVFKEVSRILKPQSYFLFSCHHPVRFAMDSANNETDYVLKLEISKNRITNETVVTGDYLSKRKIIDVLGKDTVNTWNMPIGDISKDLYEAGFFIEQIVEPRPMEEMKDIKLSSYTRLSKVPEFIIFKVKKN